MLPRCLVSPVVVVGPFQSSHRFPRASSSSQPLEPSSITVLLSPSPVKRHNKYNNNNNIGCGEIRTTSRTTSSNLKNHLTSIDLLCQNLKRFSRIITSAITSWQSSSACSTIAFTSITTFIRHI